MFCIDALHCRIVAACRDITQALAQTQAIATIGAYVGTKLRCQQKHQPFMSSADAQGSSATEAESGSGPAV